MNKKIKILLLVAIVCALISTISYCSAPYDTETAQIKEMSKTVIGNGFILRNETIVERGISGMFEPLVKDGVRVSKGSTVGTIISGNLNNKLAERLEEVTSRIEEINHSGGFGNVYSSDDLRIYSVIKEIAGNIRTYADSENYTRAGEYTAQLNNIIKKSANNDSTARDKLLVSLEEEKYSIEQQLGGIRTEELSPAAGIFYTTLDGMEYLGGNQDEVSKLTCTDINGFSEILSACKNDSGGVAKICDTYYWYVAACIPKKEAEGLEVGSTIQISIDEQPFITANILAINDGGTEDVALIIKSTVDVKGITEKRTVEFEIKREEYSGIFVPSAAIRVVNNTTGVYIISENGAVSFRAVNVIANQEDYYIVQNKYNPPIECKYKPLKVYDNILVNPEKVRGAVK